MTRPYVFQVGTAIRHLREALGVSAEAVAQDLEISVSSLRQVEADQIHPSEIRRILSYASLVDACERISHIKEQKMARAFRDRLEAGDRQPKEGGRGCGDSNGNDKGTR